MFFLGTLRGLYKELEGFERSNIQKRNFNSNIEPKIYYWFKFGSKNFLLYFDNTLDFHRRPFLLFLVIPETKYIDWSTKNGCQSLKNAFDNFYETSAFLSLLPNEQNRDFYKISITILDSTIDGELGLEFSSISVNFDFTLIKLNNCISLLKTVKIGTMSWNRFYKENDKSYGLFIETYYLLYQNTIDQSNTAILFRTADLIEVGLIVFQTISVKGKVYLSDTNKFFKTHSQLNVRAHGTNKYNLEIYTVIFELLENKRKPFNFFVDGKEPSKIIGKPLIGKLPERKQRTFLLENQSKEKLEIQVPGYFLDRKLEGMDFFIRIKLIYGAFKKDPEINIFFRKLSLTGLVYFWIHFSSYRNSYTIIFFNYEVKDGSINFKITKVLFPSTKETFYPLGNVETYEPIKNNTLSGFLSGAVLPDQKSISRTKSDFSPKEYKTIFGGLTHTLLSDNKQGSKSIYLLMIFVLVAVFIFLTGLFCFFKRRVSQRKRFSKVGGSS